VRDLQTAPLMYLKAILFLILGTIASVILIMRNPELTTALLLVVKKPLTQDAFGRNLPIWRRPVDQDMRALAKPSGAH